MVSYGGLVITASTDRSSNGSFLASPSSILADVRAEELSDSSLQSRAKALDARKKCRPIRDGIRVGSIWGLIEPGNHREHGRKDDERETVSHLRSLGSDKR